MATSAADLSTGGCLKRRGAGVSVTLPADTAWRSGAFPPTTAGGSHGTVPQNFSL